MFSRGFKLGWVFLDIFFCVIWFNIDFRRGKISTFCRFWEIHKRDTHAACRQFVQPRTFTGKRDNSVTSVFTSHRKKNWPKASYLFNWDLLTNPRLLSPFAIVERERERYFACKIADCLQLHVCCLFFFLHENDSRSFHLIAKIERVFFAKS